MGKPSFRKPDTTDLTGKYFAELYVIELAGQSRYGGLQWRVRCVCGKEKVLPGFMFRCGRIISCGCIPRPPAKPDIAVEKYKEFADLYQSGCSISSISKQFEIARETVWKGILIYAGYDFVKSITHGKISGARVKKLT